MSPKPWIRRGAAAVAVSAALTLAVQPAALAAPNWWRGQPVSYYTSDSPRSAYDRGYWTRWTAPVSEVDAEPAPAAEPSTNTGPAAQGDVAAQIFELTNAERQKKGLAPLRRNDCLTDAAQNWSNQMSQQRRMYHSNLRTWMSSCSLRSAGENVAYGGKSAEETVRMWMNSPGHRENILSPNFTQLGVGWAAGGYATQMFGA